MPIPILLVVVIALDLVSGEEIEDEDEDEDDWGRCRRDNLILHVLVVVVVLDLASGEEIDDEGRGRLGRRSRNLVVLGPGWWAKKSKDQEDCYMTLNRPFSCDRPWS